MTDYSIYKLGDGVSLEIEKCCIKRNAHEMNIQRRDGFLTHEVQHSCGQMREVKPMTRQLSLTKAEYMCLFPKYPFRT